MLPDNCFVKYKDDCSDVVEKAQWIINNEEESKEIANNGYEEFKRNHTDSIRSKEVYGHIKNMLDGKELIKKWEK